MKYRYLATNSIANLKAYPVSPLPLKMPEEAPWTSLLVSLAVIGMLALFYSVVDGAVKAGESRRQAMATHTAATLRCNALPSWDDTMACRKELVGKAIPEEPTILAAK